MEKKEKTMDVYIRMNEDFERDYCFNVNVDAPVKSLLKIFDTLPMILSPSYFYDARPIGFALSKHPGFLTGEGALLFHPEATAEKYLIKVDQDAKIGDVAWEGQLVVPIWSYNYSRLIKVLAFLGTWLYMDLPEYISPTPGTAPTTLIFNAAVKFFPALADDTPSAFNSHTWQWVFFLLHILKCGFIYLILWVGGLNPVSFNPIKARRFRNREITREKLIEVGWTSARRATPSEWREENRKLKIESAGGIVKAYHAGLLEGIGTSGVYLGPGEGWDTPREGSAAAKSAKPKTGAFLVGEKYFKDIYSVLGKKLAAAEEDDQPQIIRAFRRSGPENGPADLVQRYQERKALGDGDYNEEGAEQKIKDFREMQALKEKKRKELEELTKDDTTTNTNNNDNNDHEDAN